MDARSNILTFLEKHTRATSTEMARRFGFSRQHISAIVRAMVANGDVLKFGSTRSAFYTLPKFIDELGPTALKRRLKNEGIQEHEVLNNLIARFPAFRFAPAPHSCGA